MWIGDFRRCYHNAPRPYLHPPFFRILQDSRDSILTTQRMPRGRDPILLVSRQLPIFFGRFLQASILSTQRMPLGRDPILSTQRMLRIRNPILSTQTFRVLFEKNSYEN